MDNVSTKNQRNKKQVGLEKKKNDDLNEPEVPLIF